MAKFVSASRKNKRDANWSVVFPGKKDGEYSNAIPGDGRKFIIVLFRLISFVLSDEFAARIEKDD